MPKRAMGKHTYPGMLDNTVAGGVTAGEAVFETLVRESFEEASLSRETVARARPCGAVTYLHVTDERAGGERGLFQPECEYVYDLELGFDEVPVKNDDEVEGFYLLETGQVRDLLGRGAFKPNCAVVMLDFFIRHGIMKPDEEGYLEIIARSHRRMEFPTA